MWGPSRDRRLAIFQTLYDGSLSASEAGDQLVEASLADDNPGLTINLLLKAARERPEQHDKLVNVLLHVVKLAHPTGADGQPTQSQETRLSDALPFLGMVLNETWNGLTVPLSPPEARQKDVQRFINVNRLCAKLMTTKYSFFNYSMFALWTFRAALETTVKQSSPRHSPPEAFIPAAAAWIEILGEEIFTWDEEFEHGPAARSRPGRGGPLCPEKHNFDRERWDLWRDRFREVAQDDEEDVDERVRDAARKAQRRMAEIQQMPPRPELGDMDLPDERPGTGRWHGSMYKA